MSKELITHIQFIIDAHSTHATSSKKEVRLWDEHTPYFIHPLWCTTTLATETTLPKLIRERGMIALLYHDLLEDTTSLIPNTVDSEILELIIGLTFKGFHHELKEIWNRSEEVQLLKLYDKVSNLLDGVWMSKEIKQLYVPYTRKLIENIRNKYGELNITIIGEAILNQEN